MAATELGGNIGGAGLGPFATGISSATTGLIDITKVVSSIIGVMTVAAAIWFLFNVILGGFSWISAGADKNALEAAQKKITTAFVGLLIVVAGWTILALVGKFLGYDILISNPGAIINSLFPGGNFGGGGAHALPMPQ